MPDDFTEVEGAGAQWIKSDLSVLVICLALQLTGGQWSTTGNIRT
jgi:hypothetical protein